MPGLSVTALPTAPQACPQRPDPELAMYIIAIAWLYVALMVSIADTSVVGGVMTFLFSGLAPLALFLWVFGAPARKRTRLAREKQALRQPQDAPGQTDPHAENPGEHPEQ